MAACRYSSDILEIPVQLLPEKERVIMEAKYNRKGSVLLASTITNRNVRFSSNIDDDSDSNNFIIRRCSDFIPCSSHCMNSSDSTTKNPLQYSSTESNVRGGNEFGSKYSKVSSMNSSLESFTKPMSPLSATSSLMKYKLGSRNLALKHLHSTMSFEIDVPMAPSLLTTQFPQQQQQQQQSQPQPPALQQQSPSSSRKFSSPRRPSKSLEFSSLHFAEETRQDTIPETVMEQFESPSPCKAHSAIANGDLENNIASSIIVGGHTNRGFNSSANNRSMNKNRRRWPSLRSKFGRFGSIKKSDSIQYSVPLINQSLNSDDCGNMGVYSLLDKSGAQSLSNISTKMYPSAPPLISSDVCENKRDVDVQFDDSMSPNDETDKDDYFTDPSGKSRPSSYLKEQFFSFFQPSDNKLALKLFGNKNAVNKEKRRQQQQGKLVIHPCSNFRFYWDLMMLVLLITNLIVLPVAISFFNDDLSLHWIVFNCFSDTIFILDIFVNFRTGIITNDFADEIILDPKIIASRYVKSWFMLDLLSSIPMDYMFLVLNQDSYSQFLHAGRTLRIFRLAKLLSMLRLLRLSRLVRYVSQWEEFLNMASKFMGICKLVLLMLLLGHWNACLQFLIPMLMEYPADSWVVKCNLKNAYWFKQYTWALFKAMSHMLSIGYGRFPPTGISEAWITIVSMMTGATCYALFVGHAAAIIQSFDTSKRLYREKFKQVEEYMAYRKLPRALRQRIANYYEHRYQGKMFDEDIILTELSECLREQIINYNCRALVAAVPFFTYADQDFVSEVVTKLKFEVYQPGDLIIKEGTIGTKMYFIQEGIVDIITKDGEVATSLSDGSYFGEICLLTNAKRVASVRAETYCNLYSLDSESFSAVLENYPLMRRTMESVAAERLSKIGQNPQIVSSREDLKEDLNLVKEIVSSVTPMASDDDDDSSNPDESDVSDNASSHSGSKSTHNKRRAILLSSSKILRSSFSQKKTALKQGFQNVFRMSKSKSNLSFTNVLRKSHHRKSSTFSHDVSVSKKHKLSKVKSTDYPHDKEETNRNSPNGSTTNAASTRKQQLQIVITSYPSELNQPATSYSISDKESCV